MSTAQDLPVITRMLYAIVCSRGPGSETIVVRDLLEADGEGGLDEAKRDPRGYMENADVHLGGRALTTMDEEGVVYALAADITDHELWTLVKATEDHYDELMNEENDQVLKALTPGSEALELYMRTSTDIIKSAPALRSAMLRAFIASPGIWTSVNGWRSVENEVLTREQMDKYMLLEQCTVEDLLAYDDCEVLQLSAKRYIAGESPSHNRGA